VARTRLHASAAPEARETRQAIADRHGIDPSQVVVGNGAAELLRAAAQALLGSWDELLTPWPSYPLYRELGRRSDARVVTVPLREGSVEVEELLSAVNERTRVVTLCNPNDPTGGFLPSERIAVLLEGLPERTYVFLDEALAHFQTVERLDATLALVERFPRLIVFRTLSKAYGFPGLRAGYAVGSTGAGDLLHSISPALGLNAVSQATLAYAVTRVEYDVERRRESVAGERSRLFDGLRAMPVESTPSEANFVWLGAPALSGEELAARLKRSGVLVASGERFGDPERVRVAVRDGAATSRVLEALHAATHETDDGSAGEEPLGCTQDGGTET